MTTIGEEKGRSVNKITSANKQESNEVAEQN